MAGDNMINTRPTPLQPPPPLPQTAPPLPPSCPSGAHEYAVSQCSPMYAERGSTTSDRNSTTFDKGNRLNHSKVLSKKQDEEDNTMETWYKHKTHVIVFTFSGKPVFSRYGSESRLSTLTATLSAIVSKAASLFSFSMGGDSLRSMRAGTVMFVFEEKGPLWFVCVSSADMFIVIKRNPHTTLSTPIT
eukprot:GHVR01192726.1.p1 GENE.GHVR01192726.1~~GHVR01192726.1.p1  ORF type:complete len:188 (+),score=41.73 GHVR01192726.1:191-754(+)